MSEQKKQEIFISYGHTEKDICTDIRNALKKDGYGVWMDENEDKERGISPGDDWRVKIQKGISDSDEVLACLSKHSVRDPGVCLDELRIAVGVHGSRIRTILLESEKEVQPPPTVSHLQWLDMQDWKQLKENNSKEEYKAWFDGKMEELEKILESGDKEFDGDIHTIKTILPACSSYSHHRQYELLNRPPFIGREWLTEQLEEWLNDPNGSKIAVLSGDAGVGKSCFAAQYLHRNKHAAAGIFCRAGQPYFNSAKTIVETLAYLLACRLPAYRSLLVDMLDKQKSIISQYSESELFEKILIDPLNDMIDGGHETLCIVLDALDECSSNERDILTGLLRDDVPKFPRWLRVLVTTQNAEDLLSQLHDAQHISLDSSAENKENNLKDVRTYYTQQLDSFKEQENFEQAIEHLTQFSKGIFLYAVLTAESIKDGSMKLDELEKFPKGLSAAYHQRFDHIFSDTDYKENFRKPIGIILAAPAPMPEETFRNLLGWKRQELHDFTSKIGTLLEHDTSTLAFSHQYIAHWLSDKALSGKYWLSKQDSSEDIANAFYQHYEESKLTDYETLYLVHMLKQDESCNKEKLSDLFDDSTFLKKLLSLGKKLEADGKFSDALFCYQQIQYLNGYSTNELNILQREYLSICYAHCGDIHVRQWEYEQALEQYQKAREMYSTALEHHSSAHSRQLSVSFCMRTADAYMKKEDFEQAERYLKTSQQMQEAITEYHPSDEHKRVLCIIYYQYSVLYKRAGNAEKERKWYQKSLDFAQDLVEQSHAWEVCLTAAYVRAHAPFYYGVAKRIKYLECALNILALAKDDPKQKISREKADIEARLKRLKRLNEFSQT